MGWRGTVVLSVFLVVVGIYFWFDIRQPPDPDRVLAAPGTTRLPAPTTPNVPLLEVSPDQITRVRFVLDGQAWEVTREGNQWAGTANPSTIPDFLHDVTSLGVLTEIGAGPDELKDFGLLSPRGVFEAYVQGRDQPFTLLIGDRNPSTTGVYVRLGENGRVVLVGALLSWEFEKTFQAVARGKGDG